MFNEGNQIHNFMSSSGSGSVINYGSGYDFFTSYGSSSGSTSQKVTVPTVPVPQHCTLHYHATPKWKYCFYMYSSQSLLWHKNSKKWHWPSNINYRLLFHGPNHKINAEKQNRTANLSQDSVTTANITPRQKVNYPQKHSNWRKRKFCDTCIDPRSEKKTDSLVYNSVANSSWISLNGHTYMRIHF